MALGGGSFTSFAKVLPGTYTNYRSKTTEVTKSYLGYLALAKAIYGQEGFTTVSAENIQDNGVCLKLFGYAYNSDKMYWIRELIKGGAQTIYVYNTLSGGTKAANAYATAKHAGARGNSLKITVEEQTDNTFDVITYMDTTTVDTQNVSSYSDLESNDYVDFNIDGSVTLTDVSNVTMTGGTDGTESGSAHEDFLKMCETKYLNMIVCTSIDTTTTALYVSYAKEFIESIGNKCMFTVYNATADYPNIYNVCTAVSNTSGANGLVYWFGGLISNMSYSECATNRTYDGKLTISSNYTQEQLEKAIKAGKIVFHEVGDVYKVLKEVTALTTYTENLNDDYALGQHVRIVFGVLIQQADEFNTKNLGRTRGNTNGAGIAYDVLTDVLEKFANDECIEYVSSDVSIEKVDKTSFHLTEAFTTVVAVDRLYIDTITD